MKGSRIGKIANRRQVSEKGVGTDSPKSSYTSTYEGIIKIDEREIVHLKRNRPKGNVLELADCM
jgi:hypothetical protein